MIRATTFAGRRVAVFGLGASGTSAALSLIAGGAEVAAWDDGAASREAAASAGVPLVDLAAADWSAFAALVVAPGVPLTHPRPHWAVAQAQAAGLEVIGDIELFCRERARQCPRAPFVAITGTNGKSTTTALLAHLLSEAGRHVGMGGNIGRAVLTLEPPAADRTHVIELSSFQIDLTPSLAPSIGVLLNITPDHLDRHGPADDPVLAMQNYAAIKARVVTAAGHAVIGIDDDWCRGIERARLRSGLAHDQISTAGPVDFGVGAGMGRLSHVRSLRTHGSTGSTPIADLAGIGTLRGHHNSQNAAAAAAVALHLGIGPDVIAAALRTYPGLPHRMEEVGRHGRVIFINDSKATNADSAEKALLCFDRDIFWILGGRAKEGGIASLAPYFPRIARAYLIGEASDAFAATLAGHVANELCRTLDVAVRRAAADAAACGGLEPIVLLSPACASYDQYRGFDQRGDAFRSLVHAIVHGDAP